MLYIVLFLVAASVHGVNGAVGTLFCYWGSWSTYRWGNAEIQPDTINPHLCTHLVYAFAGLNSQYEIDSLDKWSDLGQFEGGGKDNFRKLTALKRHNPQLKVLLSIGGWNEGSVKFSQMASNPAFRTRFVNSVVNYLQRFAFDGLDFAWQWPGTRGGLSFDKKNYVDLLRELKDRFKPFNYVLSIAGPALSFDIDAGLDLRQISNYVDYISIYAYDFDTNAFQLNHGSPLYASGTGNSVDKSVKYYLANGALSNKLLLGTTIYTRALLLYSSFHPSIGNSASGLADPGPYTQTKGLLGWFEACVKFRDEGFTTIYDHIREAAYAYSTREWVAYESETSLRAKIKYASDNKLAGLTVWSLENDDNHRICGNSLVSYIRKTMDSTP